MWRLNANSGRWLAAGSAPNASSVSGLTRKLAVARHVAEVGPGRQIAEGHRPAVELAPLGLPPDRHEHAAVARIALEPRGEVLDPRARALDGLHEVASP
ncbi:MAG TPA: hypothetical protein VID68_13410 [Solirubrobacteraceae bacterium]|jgi:hypothetical protein